MSQIVVDTDVTSCIFNWRSSAQSYVNVLRGSELILSFLSIAEMRMGAAAAGWRVRRRTLLEQFITGFGRPGCGCHSVPEDLSRGVET